MNEVEIFKYENKEVRTQIINNDIWFCLKDVCDILEIGHVTDTKNRLKKDGVDTVEVIDKLGRKQQATFINESNLYKVIFQSRKAKAERFTEWVTSEVLPSIRKHGAYMTKNTLEQAIEDPDFLINLLTELKKEKEKINTLQETVKILQPKASYYDLVLQSTDLLSVTQIAKDYGMSAMQMNLLLANFEIQFCQRKQWLLYQKYANKGYTQSKTHDYIDNKGVNHTSMHTYWTQQGRLFIYDKLKENGILPLIER